MVTATSPGTPARGSACTSCSAFDKIALQFSPTLDSSELCALDVRAASGLLSREQIRSATPFRYGGLALHPVPAPRTTPPRPDPTTSPPLREFIHKVAPGRVASSLRHTAAARAALTCTREFIHKVAPGLGALTSNLSCPKKRHLTCFYQGSNRVRGKYTGQPRNNALARARPRFQRTSSAEVSVFAHVRCHGSHAHKNRLVY